MARRFDTPCAFEGCDRSNANGHALFRINPKGEPGIFMCKQHAGPGRGECNCFPHSADEPCTCAGCWACSGHVIGCTCDINWDCEHRD